MSTAISHLRAFAFLILLSLIITSCSIGTLGTMGYERFYQGELKPLTDVAIVATLTDTMGTSTSCWIDYIDDKQATRAKWGQISMPSIRELNPGKHTICVTFQKIVSGGNTFSGNRSNRCVETILDAKPGIVARAG